MDINESGHSRSSNIGMEIILMVHMTYKISSNAELHNGVTEFSYCRAVSCPHTSLCRSQLLQETERGSRVIPADEHTQANHAALIFWWRNWGMEEAFSAVNSFPITNKNPDNISAISFFTTKCLWQPWSLSWHTAQKKKLTRKSRASGANSGLHKALITNVNYISPAWWWW